MDTMHKLRAAIMKILGVVITLLFILMTLVGTYQIVTRYFFNRPSTISEELLTYSFTWMSLLASTYAFALKASTSVSMKVTPISWAAICFASLMLLSHSTNSTSVDRAAASLNT